MSEENKQQNTEAMQYDTVLGNVFDDKKMRNEEEVKNINIELKGRADKILSEFGPEGAYKMARFLRMLADKDIEEGMAQ